MGERRSSGVGLGIGAELGETGVVKIVSSGRVSGLLHAHTFVGKPSSTNISGQKKMKLTRF